jgi:hypothetical protein
LTSEKKKHILKKKNKERYKYLRENILFTNNFSGGASGKLGAQIRMTSAKQIAAYN